MGDDLRQRLAAALIARIKASAVPDPYGFSGMAQIVGATEFDLADVVLAIRDEEMAGLRQQVEQARADERARIVADLYAEGERERERLREAYGLGPDDDPCHVSAAINNAITVWAFAARHVEGP
ncbi:hypothetical protein [Streptosporangium sp. NPDC002721]|uniref:hypothetical protein n=1 Tax=Streptosporangium sp. NPDC002721 TaxID=3366188 RepID=UPI0036C751A8